MRGLRNLDGSLIPRALFSSAFPIAYFSAPTWCPMKPCIDSTSRFLETADEYFDYPSHASRQGRWQIQGIYLPEDILRKVYRDNALRLWK